MAASGIAGPRFANSRINSEDTAKSVTDDKSQIPALATASVEYLPNCPVTLSERFIRDPPLNSEEKDFVHPVELNDVGSTSPISRLEPVSFFAQTWHRRDTKVLRNGREETCFT
jgi:hypothetical protein